MKFTKMHGCGNDYIYINGFAESIEQKAEAVIRMSDRHFGIGGDGVIFINPSEKADFEMEMYNADGSRAEMCGNGIRCVGKFVYDKGLTDKKSITLESFGVVRHLDLTVINGKVSTVTVDMGAPELCAERIPVLSVQKEVVHEAIEVEGQTYYMTAVSMGNPHAVVFVDELEGMLLTGIGPKFEQHTRFPNRVNTEFVKVVDRDNIEMRVWERGTGETLACGTGACASVVACVLNDLTETKVTVKLLGGSLHICWNLESNTILMSGPAETVFEGCFELK